MLHLPPLDADAFTPAHTKHAHPGEEHRAGEVAPAPDRTLTPSARPHPTPVMHAHPREKHWAVGRAPGAVHVDAVHARLHHAQRVDYQPQRRPERVAHAERARLRDVVGLVDAEHEAGGARGARVLPQRGAELDILRDGAAADTRCKAGNKRMAR